MGRLGWVEVHKNEKDSLPQGFQFSTSLEKSGVSEVRKIIVGIIIAVLALISLLADQQLHFRWPQRTEYIIIFGIVIWPLIRIIEIIVKKIKNK